MSPDAVAQYLQHNPRFFEDYADLMAQIFVPHPHGGRAISLPERQMLTLREKVRSLEHTLADLIETGRSNDALSTRMHALTLALLRAGDDTPRQVVAMVEARLREDFAIPHAAFRLWGSAAGDAAGSTGTGATIALEPALAGIAATDFFKHPYCGPLAGFAHADTPIGALVAGWFGEAGPHLKSAALLAVRAGDGGGLLALASEDEHRFYAGMGTLYLERLAESLAAALARALP
jgi:hypothetical protein